MKRNTERIICVLMSLMLVLLILPAGAAAESGDTMTWTDLRTALQNGDSVKLTNDVTRSANETISIKGTVILDLNGFTLDGGSSFQYHDLMKVESGGNLTITDTSEVKSGVIRNVKGAPAVYVTEGCTFTLDSGTIQADMCGVWVRGGDTDSGSFIMTGGSIIGGTTQGVLLELKNPSFTMTGGSITGGRVGVDVPSVTASLTLSGNVNISGALEADIKLNFESDSNSVRFSPIRIGGPLAESVRIGIGSYDDAADLPHEKLILITEGLKGNGTEDNFFMVAKGSGGHDLDLELMMNDNGELSIGSRPDSGYCVVTAVTSPSGCGTVSPERSVVGLGSKVELSAMPADGCRFVNWTVTTPSGTEILSTNPVYSFTPWGNKSVTANFEARTYEVTFYNWDGKVLQQTREKYGTVPVFDGTWPARPEDDKYWYRYIGWDKQISKVTSDQVYKACFETNDRYIIAEGNSGTYTLGSGTPLRLVFKRASGDDGTTIDHFTNLMLDMDIKPLVRDRDYTASSGSVVIELQPSYLEDLGAGEYVLWALFDNVYEVKVKFSVAEGTPADDTTDSDDAPPATGVDGHTWLYAYVLFFAALALSGAAASRKRRARQ